jgi:short-subunit dehydrogenase
VCEFDCACAPLPQFRQRGSGIVINVTSSVTPLPLHLLSVYTGSKAAVNAFSGLLALELEPFGIRVRIVLPGRAPGTAFGENARKRMTAGFTPASTADDVLAGVDLAGRNAIVTGGCAGIGSTCWRLPRS